ADQEGFPTIGLVGVYGWQKKRENKDGPRELIPDLAGIVWQDRTVFLVYDSDASSKRTVAFAEWHLAEVLTKKGAAVKVVRLPAGPDGAKVGLDDFLVAHGAEVFRQLLGNFVGKLKADRERLKKVAGDSEQSDEDRKRAGGMQSYIKLILNSLYGVMASRHFPISNTVIANNITARAR